MNSVVRRYHTPSLNRKCPVRDQMFESLLNRTDVNDSIMTGKQSLDGRN